jgi:hypothetical protein
MFTHRSCRMFRSQNSDPWFVIRSICLLYALISLHIKLNWRSILQNENTFLKFLHNMQNLELWFIYIYTKIHCRLLCSRLLVDILRSAEAKTTLMTDLHFAFLHEICLVFNILILRSDNFFLFYHSHMSFSR